MSPLAKAQTRLKPSLCARFCARQAPLVFVLSFVVGMGMVAWWAKGGIETACAAARREALGRGASLEMQLSQASTAAEVLGMLAKQGRGGLANFQKVGAELLTAHPGLTSLELQPGGVVSDIVPRAGHERAIGFNVLNDAAQRVGANEAIARRALTLAGPVTLDHGEHGILVRVPVFQRAPDGRDSFWGFVAVSMRLREALSQAQVDELARQGYDFALFAPRAVGQKAIAIASHGLSSLQDSVQQAVRVQNLEFRLALKPHGGWIDKANVALESLAVLLISGLVSLSASLLQSRRAVEAELAEATRRLAREAADRSQAPADCRGANGRLETAQAELKQTRLALQEAESEAARLQARLDANFRANDEAAKVSQAELKEAQAALQKAQETIAQLQTRLNAAAQAEKDATSAAEVRLQQNQAAIAELQVRLEAATRSARETAEMSAAREARLEQRNAPPPSSHEAESLSPLGAAEASVEAASPAEPSIARKALRGARRKKAPQDDQLHLFGPEVSAVHAAKQSAAEAETPLLARAPNTPAIEIDAPSETPTSDGPKTPAGDGESHASLQKSSKGSGPKPRHTREPATAGAEGEPISHTPPPDLPVIEGLPALGPVVQPKEHKPAPSRRLPAAPPVDPAQLRKAVNQIVPLLAEKDPGARECLRDNRTTFRSAFTPEAYAEFEQLVKSGDPDAALEHLKKAARKHAISF